MRPPLFFLLPLLLAGCAAPYPYDRKTADELNADAGGDIRNGNGRAALKKLEFLKSKYPDFPDRAGVDFRIAEATKLEGSLWKAFTDYRDFLERYPISSYSSKVERQLFEIGTSLLQSRSSFLGTGLLRDADDGVVVLTYLLEKFPNGEDASTALRQMAQYKFQSGDFPGAILDYQQIINRYPRSEWRDLAEYRIALAHLRSVPRPNLDQSELRKAREALSGYIATHPEGAFLEEARAALGECLEELAESELIIGNFYRTIGRKWAAAQRYKAVLTGFGGTRAAEAAQLLLPLVEGAPLPESSPALRGS